jgi:hypothetical protein
MEEAVAGHDERRVRQDGGTRDQREDREEPLPQKVPHYRVFGGEPPRL